MRSDLHPSSAPKEDSMNKRNTVLSIVIASILTFSAGSDAKGFDPDLVSFGLGSWITLNDNTGGDGKDSYFNTAKANLWYHVGKTTGYIGVPLQLTLEKYETELKYALYPADLTLYFGRKLGPVEPRIGLAAPLGYPSDDSLAWTGSNSLQLLAGLGFRIGKWVDERLSVGGEALVRLVLNDTLSSRYAQGSTSGYASVKAGYRVNSRWDVALELFPYFGAYTGTDWGSGPYQSYGSLLMAGMTRYITPKFLLSAKGGYGGSVSNDTDDAGSWRRQTVLNGGINATVYLW
jgi:hypothetical protein